MRILIDARLYGLENTGIGRYLNNLIEELKSQAIDEEFIVLLRKKYFDELNFPKNWHKVKTDFKHYTFEEQIKLPLILNKVNPDLVHFPHFNIPIFWNGKFIVTIHDLTMHRQEREATTLSLPLYVLKRTPYKFVFRRSVFKSLNILVPSESVKKDLINYYKIESGKIKVIYEGFERKKNETEKGNVLEKYNLRQGYFFYVGDLYPHKNIKKALDAILNLNKNKKTNSLLVIASGRSVFLERFKSYSKNIGADKYIRFLGFVPDGELPSLYKYSKGLVYPSLAEGFGLQGLEAMAAGTIVLASNIPVFKEIYGDYAIYFDPRSITSMSKAMEFALELDKPKRDLLIEKSQNFIKKYSWKKMASETLKVYEEAIRN